MTGKEIYDALQEHLAKQPIPGWAEAEFDKAVKLGLTDGKNSMQMIPLISDIRALLWAVTVGGLLLAAYGRTMSEPCRGSLLW